MAPAGEPHAQGEVGLDVSAAAGSDDRHAHVEERRLLELADLADDLFTELRHAVVAVEDLLDREVLTDPVVQGLHLVGVGHEEGDAVTVGAEVVASALVGADLSRAIRWG